MRVMNRGQSALEFLMTYGWAILVLLVIMVVAWQMGLFNLGGGIQPGSFGFWGVIPHDFKIREDGELTLSLLNNIEANVTIQRLNVSGPQGEIMCFDGGQMLKPGGQMQEVCILSSAGFSLGSNYEVFVKIQYNDSRTGPTRYFSSGRIWGNVER
ncbi:MAG: hypothetical protein GF334_05250 [Candidatus Altiarchaeales archaeon]|nr:hypothetical protein [Candidatus Altiarchaeales archaeon]